VDPKQNMWKEKGMRIHPTSKTVDQGFNMIDANITVYSWPTLMFHVLKIAVIDIQFTTQ
jgi:hypothetical protein